MEYNLSSANTLPAMPKLYEYFGLIVMFYANEHDPVHVHGKIQGRESRAEIIIIDVSPRFATWMRPGAPLSIFRKCVISRKSYLLGQKTSYANGSTFSFFTSLFNLNGSPGD